jgi:tRNA threonylcarbamoyladenosine biosynthesis protein TsaB
MYILSIDTSFYSSVALSFGNKIISFSKTQQKAMQSESIVTLIENCLRDAKIDYSDIEVVGLNIGIGSFTGIRVGLSVANSISIYNEKIKMCEVNYFDLLNSRARKQAKKYDYSVVISEYTKINSVLKIYDFLNNVVKDMTLLKNEDLLSEISKLDGKVVLCGSGVHNIFSQIRDERFMALPRFIYTNAKTMSDLVYKKTLNNEYVSEFKPIYI